MKKYILKAIERHNDAIKSLDALGDVKIPREKLLHLMQISTANARAGWALMDLAFECGLRGLKIDAQSGIIYVPEDLKKGE